ncbi:hypothetical protein DPMN_056466 [Dreissena polymorpha]|uniref:Uncharacterized protein n=1 Tax=Dreissena polymorpha TaxID=45954 RepID=A0A9D4CTP6_DREPO|nr:hypothetical protein DPMN_056466 [Dreissena polymorpha]
MSKSRVPYKDGLDYVARKRYEEKLSLINGKGEDLKAWKSLEAIYQVCQGWVREKKAIVKGDHVIVTAKVLHSQRMREKTFNPLEPYADQYISKTLTHDYPHDLSALRDTKWFDKDYGSLVKHCQTVKIQCTAGQAKNAEFETREQSVSALWYRFRAGRITASNA